MCAGLPDPDPEDRARRVAARHALLQFSWFGLNEERCLSSGSSRRSSGCAHADKGARVRADEARAPTASPLRVREPDGAAAGARRRGRNDLLVYEEARQVFFARLRTYEIPAHDACAS